MQENFSNFIDGYLSQNKESSESYKKLSQNLYIKKANILWGELFALAEATKSLHEMGTNQYRSHLLKRFDENIYDPRDIAFKGDPDGILEPFGGFLYLSDDDLNIIHFKAFMGSKEYYTPPRYQDIPKLASHMFTLAMLYTRLNPDKIPPSVNLKLDYAMACLLKESGDAFTLIYEHGTGKSRIRKSTKTLSRKKEAKKQKAIELFHTIKNRNKSANEIVKIIQRRWGQQAPKSVNTIKRYLKEDGLI